MSLDDLITLLIAVLFVGLPLLQRILGRGSRRPGQGTDPDHRPADSDGPDAGERPGGPRTSRGEPPAQPADASDGSSELDRRIAEARRRVQDARDEAQGRGSSSRAGRGGRGAARGQADGGRGAVAQPTAASEQPAPPPLVKPAGAPAALLGREGLTLERPPAPAQPGFLGREGVREEPRKKAPPLEVSRRIGRGARSRLSQSRRVVSMKPHDITQGIVWHQILSEPVSARTLRRKPLRVR